MTTSNKTLLVLMAVLAVFVSSATAWGAKGHQIVAELAHSNLLPTAQRTVDTIVSFAAAQGIYANLTDAAVYPDRNRTAGGGTFGSHFINYADRPDQGKCGGDALAIPADCNGDKGCVTTAIGKFSRQLALSTPKSVEAANALALLIHYIGDLSQPLHDSGFALGSNQVNATYNGQLMGGGLHRVWDVEIVDTAIAQSSEGTYESFLDDLTWTANPLDADLWCILVTDPTNAAGISKCTTQWAVQAEALNCKTVYGPKYGGVSADLKATGYADAVAPVAARQIQRAGLRLSALLSKITIGQALGAWGKAK
ncbi:S1/P1 nuclease [Blastocladiella britannica]|nr:S1/P1 nuclease [Blastocladiella britannica]